MTSPDESPGNDVLLFDVNSCYETSSGETLPGEPLCKDQYEALLARWKWVLETCRREGVSHIEDPHGYDSLLHALQYAIRESENPDLFGPCSPVTVRGLNWCIDRLAIDNANSLSGVSANQFQSELSTGSEGEGIVAGGYYALLSEFSSFPSDIRLNHVVTNVETLLSGKIRVSCDNGSSFESEACIVTIPVAVLQEDLVTFSPQPLKLQKLLDQSMMCPGIMNLVWLWYPYVFWPEGYNFFGVTRSDSETAMFTTFLVPALHDQFGVKQPILMAQVFGEFAIRIESMSEESVATLATATLAKMFGNEIPNAVGCVRSTWRSDKYSKCSWTVIPPQKALTSERESKLGLFQGDTTTDSNERRHSISSLSSSPPSTVDLYKYDSSRNLRDDSRIEFAGEAFTKVFRGTVHGAVLSGQQAARNVLVVQQQATNRK